MKRYVLTYGENEYVEGYLFGANKVITTYNKEDAQVYVSRIEAGYMAERIGCKVEEI